jgi:cell division initiation protein
MRITPLDARKQEFGKGMRGYDCDEVQAFLTTLADEYEAVLVDNKQIRERVMEQDNKLSEYQGMERNLRDTLMTAERIMTETKDTASREGDIILKDAEMKARGIMEECRMRTEELRREIVSLRKEKETYLARFKSLAEAQIQFVETHKSDFEDLDRRLVDIADSVMAGAAKAETRPSFQAQAPKVFAKPVTPTAPVQENASVQPTEDGPDPFTAPSAPASQTSDEDQWRDYNPGTGSQENNEDSTQGEEAVAIADLVSESLAEAPDNQVDQQAPTNEDTPQTQPSNDSGVKFGDQDPTDEGEPEANQTEETTEEKPATIW